MKAWIASEGNDYDHDWENSWLDGWLAGCQCQYAPDNCHYNFYRVGSQK